MIVTGHSPTWFGESSADRRRTAGLIGMTILLSPLILVAELLYAIGVPCRGDSPKPST
jgi:hypothetical protein